MSLNRNAADGKPRVHFREPPWPDGHPRRQQIFEEGSVDDVAVAFDLAVDLLELQPLLGSYSGRGSAPHDPRCLLAAVLYQIHKGHAKPTQWHEALRHHLPTQWLARGLRPALSVLYDFRDRLGPLLEGCQRQITTLAVELGLADPDEAALDGTSTEADASRHRLPNRATLDKRVAHLRRATEADEQGRPLPEDLPAWVASTAAGRQRQRRNHERAALRLSELLQANEARRSHRRQKESKVRVALGDPDSVLGKAKDKSFRPLYTVGAICDLRSGWVFAQDVFGQSGDHDTLEPLLEQMRRRCGRLPQRLLADSGYGSLAELRLLDGLGVDLYSPVVPCGNASGKGLLGKEAFTWDEQEQAYTCPRGEKLTFDRKGSRPDSRGERIPLRVFRCDPQACTACPDQPKCTEKAHKGRTVSRSEGEELQERLAQRMALPEAQRLYKRRKETVERLYADWKEHRGLRRISGRSRQRARVQVGLAALGHNLLLLQEHLQQQRALPQQQQQPQEREIPLNCSA